jgi:hypothetical protein
MLGFGATKMEAFANQSCIVNQSARRSRASSSLFLNLSLYLGALLKRRRPSLSRRFFAVA